MPMRTTVSSISTVGTLMTHSFVSSMVPNEWFHGPVEMAMCGVKSITMCQEIVITLFLLWSLVETSTTGPDSRKVNPFRLSISFNGILSLHLFSPAHRNRGFICEIQLPFYRMDLRSASFWRMIFII